MVEQEGIAEIKASVDVDIYRDTPLRYLGEKCFDFNGTVHVMV